jgi:hypothetical protein
MNYKFVELSYSKFAKDGVFYDSWTKEFLREILPETLFDYLYKDNTYNYYLFTLIQSLIELCGYSEKELIHFEDFSTSCGLRTEHTIFAKNDLFTMHITSSSMFKHVQIDFYNNETNINFLRLTTYLTDTGHSGFIHKYKDLIIDNYKNTCCKSYSIGSRASTGQFGYYVKAGMTYWVSDRHVDHLEDGESWIEFMNKNDL